MICRRMQVTFLKKANKAFFVLRNKTIEDTKVIVEGILKYKKQLISWENLKS